MTFYQNTRPDISFPDQSITERIFDGLVSRPDEIVLTDGVTGESLTAQTFMEAVKSLAGGLIVHGYGKGCTVALIAPNSPDYCVIFHAVAWAGGIITTINPTYTASEIKHQLNDSGAEFLIADPLFIDVVRDGMTGTKVRSLAVIGTADGVTSLDTLYGDPIAD